MAIVAFECCTAHEVVESLHCLERSMIHSTQKIRSTNKSHRVDRMNEFRARPPKF